MCSVDVVAAWRAASASSAFCSVSVVFGENFLEGEGGRRGTLWWGGKAVGGRGVDLHVSRDHLGGGVVVVLEQFELGQCTGQPYTIGKIVCRRHGLVNLTL